MLTFSFHAHQILGFGAYAYILISFTSDAAIMVLLFQLQKVFNPDFLKEEKKLGITFIKCFKTPTSI